MRRPVAQRERSQEGAGLVRHAGREAGDGRGRIFAHLIEVLLADAERDADADDGVAAPRRGRQRLLAHLRKA